MAVFCEVGLLNTPKLKEISCLQKERDNTKLKGSKEHLNHQKRKPYWKGNMTERVTNLWNLRDFSDNRRFSSKKQQENWGISPGKDRKCSYVSLCVSNVKRIVDCSCCRRKPQFFIYERLWIVHYGAEFHNFLLITTAYLLKKFACAKSPRKGRMSNNIFRTKENMTVTNGRKHEYTHV